MAIHLPPSLESSILDAVHGGRYASLDDAMAEAASLLVQRLKQEQSQAKPPQAEAAPANKPIWEEILELTADVPDEVWDKLPTDLAERHNHIFTGRESVSASINSLISDRDPCFQRCRLDSCQPSPGKRSPY
jgi:Arc/MetJ-type ribon-helix-helix transcriptional regulator